MTNNLSQAANHLGSITLPLTTEFKQIAQSFAQQCPFAEKVPQIRRNTLAVCAVNAYLQLIEIDTDITAGDSWHPMMQMMGDVADLKVIDAGTLSCRPLLPNEDTCYVPPEDWSDRTGYVAVVIDENASQATLLGFTKTVGEVEQVALDTFEPIETLIDRVHRVKAIAQSLNQAKTAITQFSEWTQGVISSTWQAVDTFVNPMGPEFAVRGEVSEVAKAVDTVDISRAQLVDLGTQFGESVQVALVVHLRQISAGQSEILLQVKPLNETPLLPKSISLSVFDENDDLFRSTTSRALDNCIQLQISGEAGETFSVQVSKGEKTFTERFMI